MTRAGERCKGWWKAVSESEQWLGGKLCGESEAKNWKKTPDSQMWCCTLHCRNNQISSQTNEGLSTTKHTHTHTHTPRYLLCLTVCIYHFVLRFTRPTLSHASHVSFSHTHPNLTLCNSCYYGKADGSTNSAAQELKGSREERGGTGQAQG